MILDDGYTEQLEGFPQFRFRRFIQKERRRFRDLLRQENHPAARDLFIRHVSDPDGKRIPMELVAEEVAFAITSNPSESAEFENLKSGMRLMITNPLLAMRDCTLCQRWWFDEDTGRITRIGNQNVRRPEHALTACRTSRGCDRGTPEKLLAFNARNQQAFEHWMEYRAVGCPDPSDAIIRRNWMTFEAMKDHGLGKVRNRVSRTEDRRRPLLHDVR